MARRSGRLELAQWLVRADNPLTSRAMVNRIWQHHFGQGLVRTPDNFGKLGERPTHPELLDWLARRFVENGWSIKAMHRLILLSSTYQMSSAYLPDAAAVDPDNRLLWGMNRRRLEVEAIRDNLLAVSGQLDRTLGGSGFAGGGPRAPKFDVKRRSIYLPVLRNGIFDMYQIFDFVDSISQNGKRATTIVAPQALFMMNSPLVIEQAGAFAKQLLEQAELDDVRRVQMAFVKAYARPPTAEESRTAFNYLKDFEERLAATESDAAKRRLSAWQSWCQVLFASNEFIYLN